MSYVGYSNQTNEQLNALETKHDTEVAQLQTDIQTAVAEASAGRALIQSNLDAEVSRAVAKENELNAKIDQEVADRVEAVEAEKVAREVADASLNTRLTSLEAWKTENTDSLQKAIDDAIADNTALTQQVEAQLNDADSALSQRISSHITDRVATDQEHVARLAISSNNDMNVKQVLADMRQYLEAFAQTYTIKDAAGNVVAPPDFSAMATLIDGLQSHQAGAVVNSEAVNDPVLAGSL